QLDQICLHRVCSDNEDPPQLLDEGTTMRDMNGGTGNDDGKLLRLRCIGVSKHRRGDINLSAALMVASDPRCGDRADRAHRDVDRTWRQAAGEPAVAEE